MKRGLIIRNQNILQKMILHFQIMIALMESGARRQAFQQNEKQHY